MIGVALRLAALTFGIALCAAFGVVAARAVGGDPARAFYTEIASCVGVGGVCTLGLVPQATTMRDLDGFIRDHPWIADARFSRGMEIDSGYLEWTWSGAQPAAYDSDKQGGLWLQGGVVQNVMLPTTLQLGDVWLAFPPAGDTQMFGASVMPLRLYYQLAYAGGALMVEVEIACPITPARLWRAPVKLTLGARPLRAVPENARDLAILTTRIPSVTLPTWGACV